MSRSAKKIEVGKKRKLENHTISGIKPCEMRLDTNMEMREVSIKFIESGQKKEKDWRKK